MMMLEPVALLNACESLTEYWSPRIIGRVNDSFVKVAKVKGEFVWHKHDLEDEMFLVLRGRLVIEFDPTFNGPSHVVLRGGDFFVVPKNTLHRPSADDECFIALLEPVTTKHTGELVTEQTRSIEQQLGV